LLSRVRQFLLGGALAVVLAGSPTSKALAQQVGAPSSGPEPGHTAPDISNQIPPARPSPPPLAAPMAAGGCPFAGQGLRVTIVKVIVDGATVVTPGEVAAAAAPFLDRPQDLSVVCRIRDRIARLFVRKGYRLTRVDLPAQRITGGELHLAATEGFIADIDAKGLARMGPAAALASAYLAEAVGKRPTPWEDIERAVLLTRDIPGAEIGIRLHAVHGPPGAVELEADAERRRRLDVSTGVQHLGSDELGPTALYARFDANSFTRFGERTSLVLFASTNWAQRVVEFNEEANLGTQGLKGEFEINYAQTHPQGALAPLQIDGDFLSTRTGLSYPFLRDQVLNIVGGVHFETIDDDNDLGLFRGLPTGAPTLFKDRLRIATGQLELRWLPEDALPLSFNVRAEIRQGLGGLGSSHEGDANLSRAQGDPQATVVRGDGSLRWTFGGRPAPDHMGGPWIELRGAAQWASGPVLAYEQFQIGNYTIGRGYSPGAASGDRAVGGQFEAGWPIAFPPKQPVSRGSPLWFEPYAFYDTAYVTNLGVGGYSATIASAGAGVRARLPWQLNLDVAWADPLDPPFPGAAKPPGRLLLTLGRVFSFR